MHGPMECVPSKPTSPGSKGASDVLLHAVLISGELTRRENTGKFGLEPWNGSKDRGKAASCEEEYRRTRNRNSSVNGFPTTSHAES
jgi:hypothetical protein